MSSSMSMTDMVMSATSSMTMPMSTSSSDMSGHTHGSSDGSSSSMMTMDMSQMLMTFFFSQNTPLYTKSWTPTSMGQYAGTCIFLIFFSVILRALIVLRCNFGHLWHQYQRRRESPVLRRELNSESEFKDKKVVKHRWTINESVARALLDTALATVSYLLMLAVMTMNVGYFLSVLGGVFLGSFIIGGSAVAVGH